MLVITRKREQTVVIDGRIVVKVLSRKGSSIRLGIEAPKGVEIRRGEVANKPPDKPQ